MARKMFWKCRECGEGVLASPNSRCSRDDSGKHKYYSVICDNCKKERGENKN